jgi:hypothetical protein
MARTTLRPVEEFESVFKALSRQTEQVILVGGHAVNVWALTYQDRLGDLLAPLRPLTSADMDVYATRNALIGLHEDLGGKLLLSGPREITDGTLILGVEPNTRELDVLRSVHGLPKLDAQSAIKLEVCGYAVPVLFPHLLLEAKVANALKLDQRDRQDVKHVKIMVLVLREFLEDVVAGASRANERDALELLRKVLALLMSANVREVARRFSIVFTDVMPVKALQGTSLPKLAKFGSIELPRAMARLQSGKVRTPGGRKRV